MAGTRKRKHTADESQSSKQTKQQDIKAFGSVRKSHDVDNGQKKRKTVHQRASTPPPPPVSVEKSERKRKRGLEAVEEDEEENHSSLNPAKEVIFKQFAKDVAKNKSQNKRVKSMQAPSTAETPSKKTAALFDKLQLNTTTKAIPFALNASKGAYLTPPSSSDTEDGEAEIPELLQHFIQLHSAFLSALSLYYAHNGTSSPVNIQALLPMITKHWRKRTVTLEDLRKALAVGQDSQFILQDFGRAGICLTKQQPRGRAIKRTASFIDENELNEKFEDDLRQGYAKWTASTRKETRDASAFLEQLPLAGITKHDSVEKTASLFARGQQRLADLKSSQAAATHSEPSTPSEVAAEQKTTQAVQSRGTSLLDRVLAKQALTAGLPAGPTREQLERKSALHRVEDIARVLELLAGGRPRCSFSMQAIVQQLQQSLRNPISKEEVERCLDLMGKEITPGLVSVVRSNTVTGVVITKGGKVGLEELRRRIELAGA